MKVLIIHDSDLSKGSTRLFSFGLGDCLSQLGVDVSYVDKSLHFDVNDYDICLLGKRWSGIV